jgi:hypothetical protein
MIVSLIVDLGVVLSFNRDGHDGFSRDLATARGESGP